MRWLVTGATGMLGAYLLRELAMSERSVVGWSGQTAGELSGITVDPVDLADADRMAAAFGAARPDIVIHAAALARVDDCGRDPERARKINTDGTQLLASLAAKRGARLVYVSTDLVFDGESAPYRENDSARPVSAYGRSKLAAEPAVRNLSNGVVARVSLTFGPSLNNRPGMFDRMIQSLREKKTVTLFADEWRTPLALSSMAQALHALGRSDLTGIVHIGGPERLSRLEMGQRLARILGASESLVAATARTPTACGETRPRDVSLDSSLWRSRFSDLPMPSFETALADMLRG